MYLTKILSLAHCANLPYRTVMYAHISAHLLHDLLASTRQHTDIECCGLLLGQGDHIEHFIATRNVSIHPQSMFEIDPAALIAAHRSARMPGNLQILGHYHSHPNGICLPSQRDADASAGDDQFWMVITQSDYGLWITRQEGSYLKSFDPVLLAVK
jgi:desampylase